MRKKLKHLKLIKIATNAILMSSFLLFISSTCSQQKDLKCVSLCISAPVNIYKENDEIRIALLKDTILVFYYSDYLVYRLLPTAKWETGEKIKGTEPYFIYNKRDSCGILFNSLTDSSYIITCRIDSFLFNRAFRGKDLDIPVDSLWSVMEVKKENDGILIEKYGSTKQGNEMSVDFIYYYYSKKMNKVQYSFSKKLDSISGMKLFKFRLIFNSKFSKSHNDVLPKREISCEIREEAPPDVKEILSLIKKYRSIKKNLVHFRTH